MYYHSGLQKKNQWIKALQSSMTLSVDQKEEYMKVDYMSSENFND